MLDDQLVNPADNIYNDIFAMASCKYSRITNWKGEGKMPEMDKLKLIGFVEAAHRQGKWARLWASPENNMVRQALLDCGLDFINTDFLEDLKLFLESQEVKPSVLAYK